MDVPAVAKGVNHGQRYSPPGGFDKLVRFLKESAAWLFKYRILILSKLIHCHLSGTGRLNFLNFRISKQGGGSIMGQMDPLEGLIMVRIIQVDSDMAALVTKVEQEVLNYAINYETYVPLKLDFDITGTEETLADWFSEHGYQRYYPDDNTGSVIVRKELALNASLPVAT